MHSTRQGKRVVQDPKKSNDFKITFVCSTGKDTPEKSPHKCEYMAVLRRSKAKTGVGVSLPWALKQGTKPNDLKHSPNCLSKAKITFRETMLCHNRVAHCPKDSIKTTRNKISVTNKIPKSSVTQTVSVRSRLTQLYTGSENSTVNWGKLDEWGRSFVERNPGSHFDLETDSETGRFKRMFVGLGCVVRIAISTGVCISKRGS